MEHIRQARFMQLKSSLMFANGEFMCIEELELLHGKRIQTYIFVASYIENDV